jgi:hypothetical protein
MLIISAIVFFVSFYYYFKEKRLLNEFIRHSRRHRYNQDLEIPIRQKLIRYLRLSLIFFCTIIVLLIESFFKGFVEQSWKWIILLASITAFAWLYNNRKKKQIDHALPTAATAQQND